MKMNNLLQTIRYLVKSFVAGIVLGFFVILGIVAITDWVYYFTDHQYNTIHPVTSLTVPFEVVAGIFALLIGLVLFIPDFKVALANGISRRTYFLASLPSAGLAAAVFTIINLVVIKVHGLFWPINSISDVFYPHSGWLELLILQFILYFLLILTGRFITLVYYRSSAPVKWVISLAPFVLIALLLVEDARLGGTISRAFDDFVHWLYPRVLPTMFVDSVILSGLLYLLIRRAPLKD
jgi:hypothetical protein